MEYISVQDAKKLTECFIDFLKHSKDYKSNIGNGLKTIESFSSLLTHDPANILKGKLPPYYKVKGSVGVGRVTREPFLSLLNTSITTSPQSGIYIVFLISIDLRKVFITLNQGVTKTPPDQLLLNKKEIRSKFSNEAYQKELSLESSEYESPIVYGAEWNIDTADYTGNAKIFNDFIDIYEKVAYYLQRKESAGDSILSTTTLASSSFSISSIISVIESTGLQYDPLIVKRFAFSLMTKPFAILSGLAGSGKTQLALAFAKALIEDKSQMCTVSVGADWTNREPLLGYPNALDSTKYVRPESGVLDLLIEANRPGNAKKPYFLILDEMNMSYVERYFADFLSAMESHEAIKLWNGAEGDGVPTSIKLPKNLFIIGTINVDETTYMFSPKVLDRANVIEFKISGNEMNDFLGKICSVDRNSLFGKASGMAESFIDRSSDVQITPDENIKAVLIEFFNQLKSVNAEFGYRSATEIYKYIDIASHNDDTVAAADVTTILDCAMVQKLLPKLHGSRKKLVPVLKALWGFCDAGINLDDAEIVSNETKYPLTADKVLRMYRSALDNGFTSYSEA